MKNTLPPQLPLYVDYWSTRALADWLGVSVSTVKYHARQAFRGHTGRYDLNREQAQKVVNRVYQFGQSRSRRLRAASPAPATPDVTAENGQLRKVSSTNGTVGGPFKAPSNRVSSVSKNF